MTVLPVLRIARKAGTAGTLLRGILIAGLLAMAGAAAAGGENGRALFEKNCLGCHNGTAPRAPRVDALRKLSPHDIMQALEAGPMRFIGMELLRHDDDVAIAEYLSGRKYEAGWQVAVQNACKAPPRSLAGSLDGPAWNGWSPDLENRRFQPAQAAGLSAAQVSNLKLDWAFAFPDQVNADSQPTVVGGRVFIASRGGGVYALDADSGCTLWAFAAHTGVRGAIKVGDVRIAGRDRYLAWFGDVAGHIYALDADTGKSVWERMADTHPAVKLTGSMQFLDGRLYVPVSSSEQLTAGNASYPCCTFRGSLLVLDGATGNEIWRHYTIPDAPRPTGRRPDGAQTWGPSGGGVWTAPTIDTHKRRIYITTGDAFSNPAAPTTDSVIALSLDSGEELWHYRGGTGGAWNLSCVMTDTGNCPATPGEDLDMTGSPILARDHAGRDLILVGQKSGILHAIDADTGQQVWQLRVGKGGSGGGIEWGPATDGRLVFAAVSDVAFTPHPGYAFDLRLSPAEGGGLFAVNIDDGKVTWHAPPVPCGDRAKCSPAQSAAVSAIPGVVFSGSVSGVIRAYAADTGKLIWSYDTARAFTTVNGVAGRGGALDVTGPVIVGGRVYMTSGYGMMGGYAGNVLLAFSPENR